ncbi:putative electrogenic sodium bicarbonate cotransporter 4 isoform [Sesbania bispinosa]|nr:putative electrogenic sodium bicarbonate cotransporter 4 isoform [Sesbania bispinosa]
MATGGVAMAAGSLVTAEHGCGEGMEPRQSGGATSYTRRNRAAADEGEAVLGEGDDAPPWW